MFSRLFAKLFGKWEKEYIGVIIIDYKKYWGFFVRDQEVRAPLYKYTHSKTKKVRIVAKIKDHEFDYEPDPYLAEKKFLPKFSAIDVDCVL